MIELIPAIDLIDGKCVRLTLGDYSTKTVYNEDPVAMAQEFERLGVRRLHMVDLDGAKSHHIVNGSVLRAVTRSTHLIVDFGGGIKSQSDLDIAFSNGASMVTIGSVAVTSPALFSEWLHTYGADRIILGADVRDGKISINGWRESSGEDLIPFLGRHIAEGVRHVLCTDISRDGMLNGPSIALYQEILRHYPTLHLIASGGVSSAGDILALERAGVPSVVFGKAYYEGKIDLKELLRRWD